MIASLLLAVGATLGPLPADTTFQVPAGSRVVIEHRSGDIEIRGTRGREARALLDGESRGVGVSSSSGTYRIDASRIWEDVDADLSITLPADVDVEIHGLEGDIRVVGMAGRVAVETVESSVLIDGAGRVSALTVDGDVTIRDVRDGVTVEAGDGDVWIEDAAGPIRAAGIDSDITLLNVDSRSVAISSVDGDLLYDGPVYANGSYELATHDGSVTFTIAENEGARVSVSTFDGSLIPSFPITLRGGLMPAAEFTIGDGSARVEIEVFDGDIYLVRPGARRPDDR